MRKRSLTIAGHRTSIALEPEFWAGLEEIAASEGITWPELTARIDEQRQTSNLSSALRLAVLAHYRRRADGAVRNAPSPSSASGAR